MIETMKKMIEEAEKLGVEITTSLCPGAPPDLLRSLLWCWGWQALFDYFCGL